MFILCNNMYIDLVNTGLQMNKFFYIFFSLAMLSGCGGSSKSAPSESLVNNQGENQLTEQERKYIVDSNSLLLQQERYLALADEQKVFDFMLEFGFKMGIISLDEKSSMKSSYVIDMALTSKNLSDSFNALAAQINAPGVPDYSVIQELYNATIIQLSLHGDAAIKHINRVAIKIPPLETIPSKGFVSRGASLSASQFFGNPDIGSYVGALWVFSPSHDYLNKLLVNQTDEFAACSLGI